MPAALRPSPGRKGGSWQRLAEKLRSGAIADGMTVRDIGRADWAGLDGDSVAAGLAVLSEAGWLRLDIRGFYRDLGLVRSAGVAVDLAGGRYHLADDAQEAPGLLPFPDPHLTLAEARNLAQGRTPVHRKLRELVERVRP